MNYEHSQTGTAALWLFGGLAAVLLVAVGVSSADGAAMAIMGGFLVVVAMVLLAFNRLSVTVDDEAVTARFRWGRPAKRFNLADVHRVDVVRNKWWYGFGIRLTPQGWMYNVWGLDAVQLNFHDGKAFRIGTDEPEELAGVLAQRVGAPD